MTAPALIHWWTPGIVSGCDPTGTERRQGGTYTGEPDEVTCPVCAEYVADRRQRAARGGGFGMRRFQVYRPEPPPGYIEQGIAAAAGEVQFEGVVFSDGTVCVRWLTSFRSHSIWADLVTLERVHSHPEYGTVWEWLD